MLWAKWVKSRVPRPLDAGARECDARQPQCAEAVAGAVNGRVLAIRVIRINRGEAYPITQAEGDA